MKRILLSTLACLSMACEPDFTPYNELTGLRVLAVRAEPAELTAGMVTTLDALVFQESAGVASLAWSMCPWPSDPDQGFPCPVSDAAWARAWRTAGLGEQAPSLSLGTGATATLGFPGDTSQARTLCEALTAEVQSSATLPPDCDTRLPFTVRLSVTLGSARVDTVKDVGLLLASGAVPNKNPTLSALRVEQGAESKVLDAVTINELLAGEDHALRVDVPPDALETYVPTPALGEPARPATEESLTFTWFVSKGSTERIRSTYKQGVESLMEATGNVWHASDEPSTAKLYVVVRDHRGGVGFREATVSLLE